MTRTTDIAPTLLQLAGLKVPRGLDGAFLIPLWKGHPDRRAVYLETMVPRLNFGWSELHGMQDATTKVILAPQTSVGDAQSTVYPRIVGPFSEFLLQNPRCRFEGFPRPPFLAQIVQRRTDEKLLPQPRRPRPSRRRQSWR